MADILLINPSYKDPKITRPAEAIVPPLGLAYIAAYLEKAGYKVNIIDCTPLEVDHEKLERMIQENDAKIIGIHAATPTSKEALKVAEISKRVSPNSVIVIGGPHSTALPEETLKHSPTIDVVVRGEGEATMLELAQECEKSEPNFEKIKGITYQQEKIISNPPRPYIEDLDSIPHPARHLLPMDKYRPSMKWYYRVPFTSAFTSRGCPYHCTFCDSNLTWGRTTRFRSAQNVVEEIEELIRVYKIKEITFYDDTFTLNKKRTHDICDMIIKKDLDISWGCLTRVDAVNLELLKKMKRAGCHIISFGLETGSERMLRVIKKGNTLEQAMAAIKAAKEAGIEISGSFIMGMPGETRESIEETINFIKEIDLSYAIFFRAVPFPGTEIFKELIKLGKLSGKEWDEYLITNTKPFIPLDTISEKELQQLMKKAWRAFYLRPSKIFHYMKNLTSLHRLRGYTRALKTFIQLQRGK